ncbi:MAG: hypothetical protein ACLGI5_19445 [Thermoleophilia bacterium]
MTVIAHAGDWLTSLIYLVPVLAALGVLVVTTIRERRRGPADDSTNSTNESEP